ncbi:metal-dependent hydrolase [Candidatus Woesearchaeota archaeon]|nr:metal-dependent hydrolase [Candidatus Woesearchaeota archaeon]
MKWYTHTAFGFLTALFLLPWSNGHSILFVSLAVFGSLLPDIDHEGSKINRILPVTRWFASLFTHRGFFHSLFPAALLYLLFMFIELEWVGIALALGYVSHLLSDGLTKMGVNVLHPAFHIHGFIETGGVAELILFVLVVGLAGLRLWILLL